MGHQDYQQVCLNGHQITSSYLVNPEYKKDRCPDCGKPTITSCPSCNAPIKGHMFVDGITDLTPDPVPHYCDNCGDPYPWKKVNKSLKLSGLVKLIGVVGSVASIIGLLVYFWPSSKDTNVSIESHDGQSPVITDNKGNVNINYLSTKQRSLSVFSNDNKPIILVTFPSMDSVYNQNRHICILTEGTQIYLTGLKHEFAPGRYFYRIKVLEGPSKGIEGWVSDEHLKMG